MEKLTLDVSEAAALIGVSRPTMYDVLNDPANSNLSFKLGRRRLVSAEALQSWIRSQCGEGCGNARK